MQQKEYLKVIVALVQFRSVTVGDVPCLLYANYWLVKQRFILCFWLLRLPLGISYNLSKGG